MKTKRETVRAALEEYIRHRRQKDILKLIGTVDFREDWDPIRERHPSTMIAGVPPDTGNAK